MSWRFRDRLSKSIDGALRVTRLFDGLQVARLLDAEILDRQSASPLVIVIQSHVQSLPHAGELRECYGYIGHGDCYYALDGVPTANRRKTRPEVREEDLPKRLSAPVLWRSMRPARSNTRNDVTSAPRLARPAATASIHRSNSWWQGLCFIQTPRFRLEKLLQSGKLVEALPKSPPPSMPISVMYPHHRQLSPRVRVFIDWVVERLASGSRSGPHEFGAAAPSAISATQVFHEWQCVVLSQETSRGSAGPHSRQPDDLWSTVH
jgi:hypothetical protein